MVRDSADTIPDYCCCCCCFNDIAVVFIRRMMLLRFLFYFVFVQKCQRDYYKDSLGIFAQKPKFNEMKNKVFQPKKHFDGFHNYNKF